MERGLSAQELRYYLLYWDRLVIPDNNLISIGVPDEQILLSGGKLLSRPRVQFSGRFVGSELAQVFVEAQAITAAELFTAEPHVDWTVHQVGSVLNMPERFLVQMRSVKVELINALPVPATDVPIEEILDFKERRRTELDALHQYIDESYRSILLSTDRDIAKAAEIRRIREAVKDLDRASTERWKTTKKFDLAVELNLEGSKIMTGAAAAAALNFYSGGGVMIPLLTAAGALASMVKISAKASATFEPAKENFKLAYLSVAHQEAMLGPQKNAANMSTSRPTL